MSQRSDGGGVPLTGHECCIAVAVGEKRATITNYPAQMDSRAGRLTDWLADYLKDTD